MIAAQIGIAQDPSSRSSQTKPLTVYFLASGEKDPTLTPSDLTFQIDRETTQIGSVHPAKGEPIAFAVIVDTSTSMASRAESIKTAAVRVFEQLAGGQNQGYLVLFDAQVHLSKHPVSTAQAQAILEKEKFEGASARNDAVFLTAMKVLSRSDSTVAARRIIILFSDGDNNQNHNSDAKTEEAVQREGIAVFCIAPDTARDSTWQTLADLSRKTGGLAVKSESRDMTLSENTILDALNQQFAADLIPPPNPDSKMHKLTVRTLRNRVHISAPAQVALQ